MALAYFLTFTTYGTWLHGTAKGFGSVDLEHNEYGAPFVKANKSVEAEARSRMTQAPYFLDQARRDVVRDAIVELARKRVMFCMLRMCVPIMRIS